MRLHPGSSVSGASATNDIGRNNPVALNTGGEAPADGIRISNAFETLTVMNSAQAVKVARIAAAVLNGTYRVNSAAVGKAIVEEALS